MTIKERIAAFSLKALGFGNNFSFGSYGYRNYNYLLSDRSLKEVMEKGFEGNTYVYSIINRIAQTGAGLPLNIFTVNSQNERELVTPKDTKSRDFFNFIHNPNLNSSRKQFVYESLVYQLATGNELIIGEELPGLDYVKQVFNLAPQYITPEWQVSRFGVEATKYRYQINGREFFYSAEEIMHLRKFNPDPNSRNPVMGLSPLQAGFTSLSAANDILIAHASLIKNKGMAGMLVNKSKEGKPIDTEDKKMLDNVLKKRIGGADKYGSIGATNANLGFIQFAMSPTDLKILEMNLVTKRDLLDLYNVDSSVMNDPDFMKNNNRKEGGKAFILDAVLPPTELHYDDFEKKFVPAWRERDNLDYRLSIDKEKIEVLQEDQAKKAVKQRTLSDSIRKVVEGSGVEYTRESAIQQLIFSHEMTLEEADELVGENIETIPPIIE